MTVVPESDEKVAETSRWLPRWCPTSLTELAKAERNILSNVWHLVEKSFVHISNSSKHIRTISLNTSSKATPLVLIHGMGSGVGLWAMNLEALGADRPVYAFDMLGFGRSSRERFSTDPMIAEMEIVDAIEEWRKELGLKRFVLLGHSLGGFVAASYAIRYPQNLAHVVLVDPWGFPEKPPDTERQSQIPMWIKAMACVMSPFNPLAGLRAAGPLGPGLVEKIRPDLIRKFKEIHDGDTVSQYIYHCNAQNPSGETAFKTMTIPIGWARNPMIRRIKDVDTSLPLTFIYGSRSWVDSNTGYEVKYIRKDSYVDVQVVRGSGHHVYSEKPAEFHSIVNTLCKQIDNWRQNLLQSSSSNTDTGQSQLRPRKSVSSRMPVPVNTSEFEQAEHPSEIETTESQDSNSGDNSMQDSNSGDNTYIIGTGSHGSKGNIDETTGSGDTLS